MYKKFIKRFIDIVLSLIACIPFVIAFIFVAPIIYFTDRGPVFYNANRRGKGGKVFKMYKFRSMYVNAPDIRNEDGSTYNGENDPRVTKIGKVMRKLSIDELPQVLNVLKGDMSIVGPRPTLATGELDLTDINRKLRFSVRPGITGYAQAYFRNSISQEEKFSNDAFYAQNITFLLDVKIVVKTFFGVISSKNIFVEAKEPAVTIEKQEEEVKA